MKKSKKLLCLLFVTLMFLTFSVTAFASNTTNSDAIKIEIATNKESYKAWGVAEITATITNVSGEDISNVTAQAVFNDLSPAGKRTSETRKSVDVLKSGESFSFTYKATLNKSEHKLSIIEKIILFFVRLFNGGYNADNNNIDVVAENVTEIEFGKYTAKNVVQVGYDSVNSSVEENKPFSFSKEELATMEIVNTKITELTYSDEYKEYSLAKRKSEIEKILDELVENDLIVESSIIFNGEYNQFYFEYDTGIGYYIDIDEFEDHAGETETLLEDDTQLFTLMRNVANESNDSSDSVINNAIYIYGADDTDYNMVKKDVEQLNKFGLQTDLYSYLTANDYKTILLNYDLITIIEHGMEFWDDNKLALSLNEKQTTEKNKSLYADDLANKRILIENGHYCITPEFFSHYYNDKLEGSFVNLVSCQSMGRNGRENHRFSEAFANCGVSAVLGFHNDVNYVYGLDFSINYTGQLFLSKTSKEAFDHTKEIVGKDLVDFVNKNIDRASEGLKKETEKSEKNGTVCYPIITSHYSNPFDFGTFTISAKDKSNNEPAKNIVGKIFWIENTDELFDNNPNGHFEFSVTTDENGVLSDKLPIGYYGCIFNDDNYKTEYVTFSVEKNTETVLLEPVYLTPKYSTITGTVTESESGNPISNVTVEAIDNESDSLDPITTATTDSSGKYTLKLPYGDYSLSYKHSDYEDYGTSLTVNYESYTKDVTLSSKGSDSGDDDTDNDESGESGETEERPVTASGEWGAVIWTLYEDGELIINGSGEIQSSSWDKEAIKSVTIGDGITSLVGGVFDGCSNLENVTIGNSVTRIGDCAFRYCKNLTEITIPDSVTTIGNSAFFSCKNLSSAIIGNGVTTIGQWAFSYCSSLECIELGKNLNIIYDDVFSDCSSLTDVYANDINSWLSISFTSDESNPMSYADNLYFNNVLAKDITIPNNILSIGDYAFYGCENITSVSIPNSIAAIGTQAFYKCSKLENLTIPDSVLSIDKGAFAYCNNLTSVDLSENLSSVESELFGWCYNLKEVTIPNSVDKIGDWAFYDCYSLVKIVIGKNVKTIGERAFFACESLNDITIPDGVTSIGGHAFYNCDSLTSITIPNSVTSIGYGTFASCNNLTDVYYSGTQEEWEAITIGDYNEDLTNATIHYNS